MSSLLILIVVRLYRYLSWESGWFCRKRGKTCVGMTVFVILLYHSYNINNSASVPLEKVLQFFPGQTTSQFQRWSRIYGEAKDTSFSIIYTDGNGKEVTIGFVLFIKRCSGSSSQ